MSYDRALEALNNFDMGLFRRIFPSLESDDYEELLPNACIIGNLDVVKFLFENGAFKIGPATAQGLKYPFNISVMEKHYEIADYFLEKGLDINTLDINDETSLSLFFETKDIDGVLYLIGKGADISVETEDNKKLVLMISVVADEINLLKILGMSGMDMKDEELLLQIVGENRLEMLKYVIESGNTYHLYDASPYLLAIEKKYFEVAKYLIENGAETNDNYLFERPGKCNTSNISKNKLNNIKKLFGLEQTPDENVCSTILRIFSEKKDREIGSCNDTRTLMLTDLKDVDPLYFYSIVENGIRHCGDIRDFVNLTENPLTRVPYSPELMRQIEDDFIKIQRILRDEDDEPEIQESENAMSRRLMGKVLELLSYPNDVEYYVNADRKMILNFIRQLRGEVLTNDVILNIMRSDNQKIALATSLYLTIKAEQTQNGTTFSSKAFHIVEIYNNIFKPILEE